MSDQITEPAPSAAPSPLLGLPGAVAGDGVDAAVAAHYGSFNTEQRSLVRGEGFVDLSHRGVVRVTGPDRLTWLHSLTTQHLESLAPGQPTIALVLSPNGHVEHAMYAVDDGETFTAHVEPGEAAPLVAFLERMRFMMRVEVADATDELAVCWRPTSPTTVEPAETTTRPTSAPVVEPVETTRPTSAPMVEPVETTRPTSASMVEPVETARSTSAPVVEPVETARSTSASMVEPVETTTRPTSLTEGKYDLVPRDQLEAYAAAAGPACGLWAFEALRIARGEPRLGLDTDHRTIPNEVGWIETAVHLEKGCYRGQETVARVHNLGRPPRRLTLLHLDGSDNRLPVRDGVISLGGRQVGSVGTSARHHELGPVALALLKRNVPLDAQLDVDGLPATQEVVVDPEVGLHFRR